MNNCPCGRPAFKTKQGEPVCKRCCEIEERYEKTIKHGDFSKREKAVPHMSFKIKRSVILDFCKRHMIPVHQFNEYGRSL